MFTDKSTRDILAGLVFIGFGLAFAIGALNYDMGRAIKMGPGYLPMITSLLLVGLGTAVAVQGWRRSETIEPTPIPWRGLILIVAVIGFFGLCARGVGLGPATFVTAAVTALASRHNGPVAAIGIGVGMAVLCVLVFRVGLGISIPTIGPWFGF
ncbi:tripartite tricarboxylate transporter TctB family protein [Methylobrevis albus]|uniref:Tripartite tricarboxylate transporter TctB family protein n=1 Tax=Methylobrevis albus TaxID=2793297 RepID=A0A931MZH5_9HYPH|nr:tripartite tricarboxylate transporter TctB family protein [Methylobrevis albus]MBH0239467.1 tripartite tricarboxylate transporter TctB family protein [Methylobrevis albus]